MPRSPVAYIDVSFFVHATEDPEKVLKAAQNMVSTISAENICFRKSKLKGEYGNPIIYFKTRIREEKVLNSILRYISSELPLPDKEELSRDLTRHLERGSLYMRFDKQVAFKGNLRFCKEDPIHVRIRFRKSKIGEVTKACRKIGLLPESYR